MWHAISQAQGCRNGDWLCCTRPVGSTAMVWSTHCSGVTVVSQKSSGEGHLQPSMPLSPWMASRCPNMDKSLRIFIFLNCSSGEVCAAAHAITQCLEMSLTSRQSTALLLLSACSEGGFHYCLTPAGREVE